MRIYAVIDTNVIVSAILSRNPDAATVKLFNLVGGSSFTILFNEEILAEYIDVLHRSKFHFPKEYIDRVVEKIKECGLYTDRVASGEEFPDPSDAVFYEVALSKEDSYLVTGNLKHFPQSSIVVTPAQMLEILGID